MISSPTRAPSTSASFAEMTKPSGGKNDLMLAQRSRRDYAGRPRQP